MKIFIHGSCVTRDAFNPNNKDEFNIVEYYARYSLARLAYPPVEFPFDLIKDNITSPFQQRLLKYELENKLVDTLRITDFDYLVIDCVDDRFGLINYIDSYITNSDELRRSKILDSVEAIKISAKEDRFYELWEIGLKRLLDVVDSKKVIINNVLWSEFLNNGEPASTKERIDESNIMMEKFYKIASKYIDDNNFINYPKNIFIGDVDHKWGASPYHYIKEVYDYLLSYLRQLKM